jgi:pyrimidine-specific ribonucleoside hydrolase
MKKLTLTLALLYCINILAGAQTIRQKPVNIIFDTDMGPDYDDVGAIVILHAMADKGEAKVLATMASTNYEGVVAVLSIFNTYFKRPNIPIGVPKGYALNLRDTQHWTDSILAKYPHQLKSNNQAPDAIKLYRKILAAQPDGSVTVVSVGFLTNLANLLKSGSDEYSNLSGEKLVAKKVKLLVSMAGRFPAGGEFNVIKEPAAGKYTFKNWPTPVIFSGFEIGINIRTGLPLVNNAAIKNSPVKDVFRISIPQAAEDSIGRRSWDETAVLVGVRGYAPYYTLHKGKIIVNDKGENAWNDKDTGHGYLVEALSPQKVEELINTLMMHPPMRK